jgi:hypothetical protein
MRRCLGHVVPGDDEVPEAVRERTYQKYPNPIYEMGWVLINILDRNRLRGGCVVERYVDLSARSCTIAPGHPGAFLEGRKWRPTFAVAVFTRLLSVIACHVLMLSRATERSAKRK